MSSSADENRHFVKCFLQWLKRQVTDSNFSSDVVESIEVAVQCLEAAYEIPSEAEQEETASSSGARYPDVDLFEMFQSSCVDVSADRKERAEVVKNDGNRLMKESKFNEALLAYNKAITLDATNATFYCNRAAAYIRLSDYEKAIADCKLALVYNPQYSKAYARMGIAYSNLRRYDEAREAYGRAIELEPNNEDYKNNLRITENQLANTGQQLLNCLTNDSGTTDFRQLIQEMMNDPQMSLASCEAASRIASQFPEIFEEFRTQWSGFLNRGGGGGAGGNLGANLAGLFQMPPPSTATSSSSSTQQQQQQQPPESTSGSNSGGAATSSTTTTADGTTGSSQSSSGSRDNNSSSSGPPTNG